MYRHNASIGLGDWQHASEAPQQQQQQQQQQEFCFSVKLNVSHAGATYETLHLHDGVRQLTLSGSERLSFQDTIARKSSMPKILTALGVREPATVYSARSCPKTQVGKL